MRILRLTMVLGLVLTAAPSQGPLRVLRVSPASPAERYDPVVVTFNRPVAGGLDATVQASAIFRIEPAAPGVVRWRDPVSLVFEPASPLEAGTIYRVTVDTAFQAMDGSRLTGPYLHEFRVGGPTVLAGDPVGEHQRPRHVTLEPELSVLVDGPVEPAALAALSRIELTSACGGGTVALRAVGERPLGPDDEGTLLHAGWWLGQRPDGDPRRVIGLAPVSALPMDCDAVLVVPARVESGGGHHHWRFRTHGTLQVTAALCGVGRGACPTGPARVRFSTPVRGAEVLRHVRLEPDVRFTVRDTTAESDLWELEATLRPRQTWRVVADAALTDVFGQRLTGRREATLATTGFAPSVGYEHGRLLVERRGAGTLAVQHVNVRELTVISVAVPDSMEAELLRSTSRWDAAWADLKLPADTVRVPVRSEEDVQYHTGITLPRRIAGHRSGTLRLVRVSSPELDTLQQRRRPVALVQVTNLGVNARVGVDQAMVWVTTVSDGRGLPGVRVTLHDGTGGVRAHGTTDAQGLVALDRLAAASEPCLDWRCQSYDGYVVAELGDDRAVVAVDAYDAELGAWRFGVWRAWGQQRAEVAAAVFTERGIYRPGEPLYVKAIVRTGPLGALRSPAGDSMRWVFRDREEGVLRQEVVRLGEFGTADQRLELPASLPLGGYSVDAQLHRGGQWTTYASAWYQVAEYRPPEFLVDVAADPAPRMGGDTIPAAVTARYLFGAPMAGATVSWHARRTWVAPWELRVPGADGWRMGVERRWWEGGADPSPQVLTTATDTLDAAGRLDFRVGAPATEDASPYRLGILATVTDANRQAVTSGATVLVHPAAFYVAARQAGDRWFWQAGEPVDIEVVALRPDGERVADVPVQVSLVRREWHRVRRTRGGVTEQVGAWVEDTVASCPVRTAAQPRTCRVTPPAGGSYTVALEARDDAGRRVATTFHRWATGPGWVPWSDESQLVMDVILDRERYDVGDTATVMLAAPFTDAEAWVTIERERVLETRRIRITDGATTFRLPIDERLVPNAYVSVVLVRGRSAAPGPVDDPGRPTLRVGYAQLQVTPAVKRLAVEVSPERPEYRPGDQARVALRVSDSAGRGQRAEVTLWAVDEGVLALTGYQTPDPLDLVYPPRGVGVRLASNLANVAAQTVDGQKGRREPGGGGGADLATILRSRFQTTAFFLGSVVTDASGRATAEATLPDNLTTFRVMAVAVTAGDRYGAGESDLLVSRPLLARPALPRFVRPGDRFEAGVIVNSRMARAADVRVDLEARGIGVTDRAARRERVEPFRARDVRFGFRAEEGDSATFQFVVRGGGEADAVRVGVPVRPRAYPLVRTVAGVLHDTATVVFQLDEPMDPARSRVDISFGTSPLAFVGGAARRLQVYPYWCSEQIASGILPVIALHRAGRTEGAAEIERAIVALARRQRPDGGIGFWSVSDWTTPHLTAHVGRVLLEAEAAGFPVADGVLDGVAGYLERALADTPEAQFAAAGGASAVAVRWSDPAHRLSERLAAVDLLSRMGRPAVATENSLLRNVGRLRWEDRVLLASVLARRVAREGGPGAGRALLETTLGVARVEGRLLVLPDSVAGHSYFGGQSRPAARLLEALMVLAPDHPLVGPTVERLVVGTRIAARRSWGTYDEGQTVLALARFAETLDAAGPARVVVQTPRQQLELRAGAAAADTALTVERLGTDRAGALPLRLTRDGGGPVFYYVTVWAMPAAEHPDPVDRGMAVERWYEDPDTGAPIVAAAEGQIVRVRLRVTVPAERTFVVLDDPLPAGLEVVDLSLRTVSPFGAHDSPYEEMMDEAGGAWAYGRWDSGMWSPFDHREYRDDRVVYSATVLWPGTHSATYLARATTAGTFLYPPAHAEEMYNPAVNGRSGGGTFTVRRERP
jgi:alpha-2-macroglobulin